jgi:hypothetical protein
MYPYQIIFWQSNKKRMRRHGMYRGGVWWGNLRKRGCHLEEIGADGKIL